VAEDVDPAEPFEGLVAQAFHIGVLRHVADHAMRFATDRLDLACGFSEPRLVDVGEDHIGAAAGELVGHAPADPAGAASDERDLSLDAAVDFGPGCTHGPD